MLGFLRLIKIIIVFQKYFMVHQYFTMT